ncbi:uncharacterized protein LOC133903229 [Phragmites australis]|uniref:uncharacterized protein LOC133903229 n=1 Tax=Phragmites australis TaxID=29695 RepID=UPI002D785242|nr:uncharacterized protein LOC133903229 [Phragmites australis]
MGDSESSEKLKLIDCITCRYFSSGDNLTIDHVIPISRGAKWEWENLELTVLTCVSGSQTVITCTTISGCRYESALRRRSKRVKATSIYLSSVSVASGVSGNRRSNKLAALECSDFSIARLMFRLLDS